MKYLQEYEQYKETGQNYYTKYLFNVGDIVKHRYKSKDRLFKIKDRKYYTDPKKQNYINQYSIETIDDFLDEDNF
jgi:hypothetical protein